MLYVPYGFVNTYRIIPLRGGVLTCPYASYILPDMVQLKRLLEHINRTTVAKAIGADRPRISLILSSTHSDMPSIDLAYRLAKYFECTIDEFVRELREMKGIEEPTEQSPQVTA